ncbi:site-specific DNA-methyltransferase, partial [Patescibacteria group bacterium]|nr:site-specific DNA-methyltransferase [Patescibacteria group bacterium]
NSNFQPFVNKKDVKDRDEDIPAEPEMIQAFRDTWELGIHSYLTHLRDRLLLAKELLNENGSVFVQINDTNLHHVKEVLDEIFDRNFIALIAFQTATTQNTKTIPGLYDYLIWYSKSPNPLFNHLFRQQTKEELENIHNVVDKDGARYKAAQMKENWSEEQLENLKRANRLTIGEKYVKRFDTDFPFTELHSIWPDTVISTFSKEKIYVVQTNYKVVERCILMTTNPGDLVLDPTCGSGVTAFAAEKCGRRWITCDTSRVAVTLAKQRLMTSKFDYYELMHAEEGLRSGFKYKSIPHITVSGIANNEPTRQETLYDQPSIEKNKVRVTGPFTVEAVPSLRVKPFDGKELKIEGTGRELAQTGETGNQTLYRDELKSTGIRTVGNKIITFSQIEPMLATKFLHAKGEILEKNGETKKAYISFGPDFGPLEQRQVEEAIKEARAMKEKPNFIIFAAFHFDPEAAKDIDQMELPNIQILKAQMSVDLLTVDLRKKRSSNQSYWLIGQPDVEVIKQKDGNYKVRVNGFDYYNPISGEIESKSNAHIAMWFLDTDYDERSLLPDQVFFPMKDSSRDWTKLAKALNGEVDEELLEAFTGVESLPFKAGEEKKIAVKIIDNRGIESFVIKNLE